MSLLHTARRAAQRFGVDVQRYPASDPTYGVTKLLQTQRVDLVVDVGANDGGYAASIRRHGYAGAIRSFEPLAEPFAALERRAARDPLWVAMRCAVGDEEGSVQINVAGNGGASSSLLPMLDAHREAAPQAVYIGTETVALHRLDAVVESLPERTYLKLDVQGYERAVLDGAAEMLASGRVIGVQMEVSFAPLYENAMTWREGLDRAEGLGMTLMALVPGFTDPRTGRMLQADAIFYQL